MSVALRTFAVLPDLLDAGADVAPGTEALLDAAVQERPHPDWQRLVVVAETRRAGLAGVFSR